MVYHYRSSWTRGAWGRDKVKISTVLATDLHGVATGSREGSDETVVSVGETTVLRSSTHRLHAGLSTGLRHHAFRQSVTAIRKVSYRKLQLFNGIIY